MTEQTRLALADGDADTALKRVLTYRQLAMIDFAKAVLPGEAEVQAVLQAVAGEPKPAAALVAGIESQRQAFVFRSLTCLVKMGVLKLGA